MNAPDLFTISEHEHQSLLVSWFNLQYPKLIMFAIPNGTHLAGDTRARAIKMAKLKAEGLTPGVADLFLMLPKAGYHGLFIEMKSAKGTVSPDQSLFLSKAQLLGYQAHVCWSFDEAKSVIEKYMEQKHA